MTFTLEIPGTPRGKGRPRFSKGRVYTPAETVRAEDRIRNAWTQAGRPHVDGPLWMDVFVIVERPGGHWRVNGELSAAGRRCPYPTKRPDLDNILKLCADSLNKCAYSDDSQIVRANLMRRWARDGEREHIIVSVGSVRELREAA